MIADSIEEVDPRGGHELCGIARTMAKAVEITRAGTAGVLLDCAKTSPELDVGIAYLEPR
jgi:hypothetical protein